MASLIIFTAIFSFVFSIVMFFIYKISGEPDLHFNFDTLVVAIATFCFIGWIAGREYQKKIQKEISKEIPAIEVYRGTTILKINGSQVDGKFVPKDSIVVYRPYIDNSALQDTTILNK